MGQQLARRFSRPLPYQIRRTLRKRNLKEFGRSTQSRTEINGFGDRRVAVYTMLLRMHVVGLAPTKSVDA